MVDGNRPYIVPMNFGAAVENEIITIYLHGTPTGKKHEILRQNANVCIEVDCEHRLTEANEPCGYGFNFASVIGEGRAEILSDPDEKAHGLSVLMAHQTGKEFFFTAPQTESVSVIKIALQSVTGKRRSI